LPELLCFSKWDIDLFTKGVSTVKKFNVVGSLKSANAKEYVKKNKIKIENEKYDICLISEARMEIADFTHIENYENFPGIIAEFTHRLCKEKNMKLIFAGRQKLDDPFFEMETHYYKGYLKNYDFKIDQKKENEYATHVNMMQSKLIISQGSSAAREAVSFKKKVLQCGNFEGHPDIPLPIDWPCQLKDKSYEEFEKRVLTILSMSNSEYEKALNDKMSLVMEYELDTISLIKKRISEITI